MNQLRKALFVALSMATSVVVLACDDTAGDDTTHATGSKKSKASTEGAGADTETGGAVTTGTAAGADGGAATSSDDAILVPTPPPPLPPAPPAEPAACTIPEQTGVATVTPTFVLVDANNPAPTGTGGNLTGSFRIDKATVYLPSSLKGLVKLPTSTGAVVAWAVFDGKRHRFTMNVDVAVDSKKGPQKSTTNVSSHGTYTVAGNALKVATTCDQLPIPSTEVTYSDNGARVTFLLKSPTNRGDVIIALEAPRDR